MTRAATSHGHIAYSDTGGTGPVVLFVHGNSSAKEIFGRQLSSALLTGYRCVAVDLPGHGASDDAPDPQATYSIHGFADAVIAFLAAIHVQRAVVVGWSLGGHIALELLARWPGTVAAWITGTPPAGPNDLDKAFLPSEHMALTFKSAFTADEAREYAQETVGADVQLEAWMLSAAQRADGRFRPLMLASVAAGQDLDGRAIAATCRLPLAVVSGADEPFVDNRFLHSLSYAALWDGQVHILAGQGHMPFWQAPDTANALLARFLAEVA